MCELNEDLVYLEITSFMGDSEDLYYEQVMPLLEPYSGVIIDIRHNGGGNSYNGDIVLNSFTDQPLPRTFRFESEFSFFLDSVWRQ